MNPPTLQLQRTPETTPLAHEEPVGPSETFDTTNDFNFLVDKRKALSRTGDEGEVAGASQHSSLSLPPHPYALVGCIRPSIDFSASSPSTSEADNIPGTIGVEVDRLASAVYRRPRAGERCAARAQVVCAVRHASDDTQLGGDILVATGARAFCRSPSMEEDAS